MCPLNFTDVQYPSKSSRESSDRQAISYEIEHSGNKIITYFENEVGPGVLLFQFSTNIQSAGISHNKDRNQGIISCTWSVPVVLLQCTCLLSAGLEHSRSDLGLRQLRLYNNFIFGILS